MVIHQVKATDTHSTGVRIDQIQVCEIPCNDTYCGLQRRLACGVLK